MQIARISDVLGVAVVIEHFVYRIDYAGVWGTVFSAHAKGCVEGLKNCYELPLICCACETKLMVDVEHGAGIEAYLHGQLHPSFMAMAWMRYMATAMRVRTCQSERLERP
jgi:hypothetical protein